MMKIGYPVVSFHMLKRGVTPYREVKEENASHTMQKNLEDLEETLRWNEEQGIKFYRLSNNLSYEHIAKLPNINLIEQKLNDIGEFCRLHGHRLSFHCSHYAVLASPKDFVRRLALREIESQSRFFDMLGYRPSHWNKINIHIGGAYGDREKTADTWLSVWDSLSSSAKSRLVVENDDKDSLYSVKRLYDTIHKRSGIPITFDSFHHNFCHDGLSKEEAANLAASTWGDNEPCFHFASSKNLNEQKSVQTAHATWIYEEVQDWGTGAWTMVESNGRDVAVLSYLKNGQGNFSIEQPELLEMLNVEKETEKEEV
jgi:UV DNA damage endonuclease